MELFKDQTFKTVALPSRTLEIINLSRGYNELVATKLLERNRKREIPSWVTVGIPTPAPCFSKVDRDINRWCIDIGEWLTISLDVDQPTLVSNGYMELADNQCRYERASKKRAKVKS